MRGSFTLLEFADLEEPSVVYVESPAGARLIEKPAQFASHREVFKSLTKQSILWRSTRHEHRHPVDQGQPVRQ